MHRVGRTGRADAEGWAFSLASLDEMGRVGRIEQLQGREFEWQPLTELTPTGSGPRGSGSSGPLRAPMVTLQILGGRKDKIRPGDILGALTGEAGFTFEQVGKINVTDTSTYVAVARGIAHAQRDRGQRGAPIEIAAHFELTASTRFAASMHERVICSSLFIMNAPFGGIG